MSQDEVSRVTATPAAIELIEKLKAEHGGVPFYMSDSQFEYWQHTQLIIDCVPGNGGMFSLERPSGLRFLTRSRLFDDNESAWLDEHPVEHVTG